MYPKSVVLCVTFLFLEQSKSHILDRNVSQSDCQSICEVSGSQAEFDVETKSCQCLPGKNIDDIDVAVIQKNVKLISEKLKTVQPTITKRDVSTETEVPLSTTEHALLEATTIISGPTTATTALNNEGSEELNVDDIVGQQTPHRRIYHPQHTVTPRRHQQSRSITEEQQRLIIQQIHDRLTRLTQISDQRLREIEMEAIRASLRQLSQTQLTHIPQQKTRMRNIEDARRRLQRPRLPHPRLLGTGVPKLKENSTESELETFHGRKHHFEIITQDPSLIDE